MGSAIPEPPKPIKGLPIYGWALSLWSWIGRHGRVYAGAGIRETATDKGRMLSAIGPDPLIGQVILHGGTLIGSTANRWLECDGTEYDVADYPMLFEAIGAAYGGNGTTTFKVPPAGVFPVFSGNSPNFSRDAITYTAGDLGGYNLHGKTENNHRDHSFDLDLEHIHDISGGSTGTAAAGGDVNVMTPTTTPDTGEPKDWGPNDKVPSGANNAEEGSITRSDDIVTVTLKHRGYEDREANSGDVVDDVDNRPTYAAFKAYIRALP